MNRSLLAFVLFILCVGHTRIVEASPKGQQSPAFLNCMRVCLRGAVETGSLSWSDSADGPWNVAALDSCWSVELDHPVYFKNDGDQPAKLEFQIDNGCDTTWEWTGQFSYVQGATTVCFKPWVSTVVVGSILGGAQRLIDGLVYVGKLKFLWGLFDSLEVSSGGFSTSSSVASSPDGTPKYYDEAGGRGDPAGWGSIDGGPGVNDPECTLSAGSPSDSVLVLATKDDAETGTFTLVERTPGARAVVFPRQIDLLCPGDYVTYRHDGSVVSSSICGGSQSGDPTDAVLAHLSVSANPLTGDRLEFHYELVSTEAATLSIYDVRGRMMKRFHAEGSLPGLRHSVWDRRDESGIRAAPGTYFYVVVQGTHRQSGHLVILP